MDSWHGQLSFLFVGTNRGCICFWVSKVLYLVRLLLDYRFAAENPPLQLSSWLRQELREQRGKGDVTSKNLEQISEELTQFFLRNLDLFFTGFLRICFERGSPPWPTDRTEWYVLLY